MIFLSGDAVSSNEFVRCCGVEDPPMTPPPCWRVDELEHFIKIIKGINVRNNIRGICFIIFPVTSSPEAMMKQLIMTQEILGKLDIGYCIAYYEDPEVTPKGMKLKNFIFYLSYTLTV